MKNDPKEKPEVIEIPEKDRERVIPPDLVPEPEKHETIQMPEKKEEPKKSKKLTKESFNNDLPRNSVFQIT